MKCLINYLKCHRNVADESPARQQLSPGNLKAHIKPAPSHGLPSGQQPTQVTGAEDSHQPTLKTKTQHSTVQFVS